MESTRSPLPLRCARFLVAAVLGLVGSAAHGERLEFEATARPPIELAEPRAGTALVGGATAQIAWLPTAEFGALAGATEWEAFLSVDGGRTYPVRLTPHLDLGIRRFSFSVPDLPSEEVRLLLRVGDEQAERSLRFATRLRIVRPASPLAVEIAAALTAPPAAAPGEAAIEGGAGVLFWVDGHRDGSQLRHRSAVPLAAQSASVPALFAGGSEMLKGEDSDGLHTGARPAPQTHPATALRPHSITASVEPLFAPDILLLIQRQNE
jgi:hypothetical protein